MSQKKESNDSKPARDLVFPTNPSLLTQHPQPSVHVVDGCEVPSPFPGEQDAYRCLLFDSGLH